MDDRGLFLGRECTLLHHVQTGWAHSVSYAKNITTFLSGIQQTERDAYYSPSPSTDVKNSLVRTLQSNS